MSKLKTTNGRKSHTAMTNQTKMKVMKIRKTLKKVDDDRKTKRNSLLVSIAEVFILLVFLFGIAMSIVVLTYGNTTDFIMVLLSSPLMFGICDLVVNESRLHALQYVRKLGDHVDKVCELLYRFAICIGNSIDKLFRFVFVTFGVLANIIVLSYAPRATASKIEVNRVEHPDSCPCPYSAVVSLYNEESYHQLLFWLLLGLVSKVFILAVLIRNIPVEMYTNAYQSLRSCSGYCGKTFRFLAISFAVMVNTIVVCFGCVFVVAPFIMIRCLVNCIVWLAGTLCLIIPSLNRYAPIFGIEPLPTPWLKEPPPTQGSRRGSVCSNLAFSVVFDQNEMNKPPLDRQEKKLKKKRKVLKRTVSEWTIHVAADKERRIRAAVTRGYETDNESAVVKKKIMHYKKRRMTMGGGEGTSGCWT